MLFSVLYSLCQMVLCNMTNAFQMAAEPVEGALFLLRVNIAIDEAACYNNIKGVIAMLFIQYPPCSTCQKAKKWLDENAIAYEDRHIKENKPTYEELKAWYEKSGLPLKKFFNTSGLLYKSLNLKEKLPTMSEEEQLRLLATDGMLVKRPVVVKGDIIHTGFKEADWEKLK